MDSKLFRNKFRISSTRLRHWDYTNGGYYFVTVCTHDKEHFFGEISNRKIELSKIGQITRQNWKKIPEHFSHIKLDKFIIMPNHIHGIVFINVETRYSVSQEIKINKFSKPVKGSLSVVINRFKGSVKRQCNEDGYKRFHWQKLFHDRIIRNEKELYNVRKYIENNPVNWINDEYF